MSKEEDGRRIAAQYMALAQHERREPTTHEFLQSLPEPKVTITNVEAHASVLQEISGLKAEAAVAVPSVSLAFALNATGTELLPKVGRHRVQAERGLVRLLYELTRVQATRQNGDGGQPELERVRKNLPARNSPRTWVCFEKCRPGKEANRMEGMLFHKRKSEWRVEYG